MPLIPKTGSNVHFTKVPGILVLNLMPVGFPLQTWFPVLVNMICGIGVTEIVRVKGVPGQLLLIGVMVYVTVPLFIGSVFNKASWISPVPLAELPVIEADAEETQVKEVLASRAVI